MQSGWHHFKAPIDGAAYNFAIRCEDGVPKRIYCTDPRQNMVERVRAIPPQLDDVNKLLHKGLPWAAVTLQKLGDIGAVIEAAEARRAEIYGSAQVEDAP
jgi:hypothetical protein